MHHEPIFDPDLAIIDPHQHLRDRRVVSAAGRTTPLHALEKVIAMTPRDVHDELLADVKSGHNVRATVLLECTRMDLVLERTGGRETPAFAGNRPLWSARV